jgi:hypothetical protein
MMQLASPGIKPFVAWACDAMRCDVHACLLDEQVDDSALCAVVDGLHLDVMGNVSMEEDGGREGEREREREREGERGREIERER